MSSTGIDLIFGISNTNTKISHAGIATHCIPSNRLEMILDALAAEPLRADAINRLLENYTADYEPFTLEQIMPYLEDCFQDGSIDNIMGRLEKISQGSHPTEVKKWAIETLTLMRKNSPYAMEVPFFVYCTK